MAGPEGAPLDARAVRIPRFDVVSGEGCPVLAAPEASPADTLYYWDYLHLDYLLNAQNPKSVEHGEGVHDEYFFIVVHQTYELWFKQILRRARLRDGDHGAGARSRRTRSGIVLARLRRINQIQRLLVTQMDVLETLTPLDFLDFRSLPLPASGFQSVQFRLIENEFGLLERDRLKVEGHDYVATLREDHAELRPAVRGRALPLRPRRGWLARLPFMHGDGYDFVDELRGGGRRHARPRPVPPSRAAPTSARRYGADSSTAFDGSARRFDAVFDETAWEQEVREGSRRFSYEAFMAALFISLYREEPVLQLPFQILETLIDIDETLTLWRQRHALDGPPDAGTAGRVGRQRLRLPGRDGPALHPVQGPLRRLHLPPAPCRADPRCPNRSSRWPAGDAW